MASAVGIAVLDAIKEDKLQENCADLGTYFIQELAKIRDEYRVRKNNLHILLSQNILC